MSLLWSRGEVAQADFKARRSRWSDAKYLAVRLRDSLTPYSYLDWFPDFNRVAAAIQPGDRVTLWVDEGNNNWVWQIEKNGNRLVSFDEVSESVRFNNSFDGVFGLGLLVLAVIFLLILWRRRNAGASCLST